MKKKKLKTWQRRWTAVVTAAAAVFVLTVFGRKVNDRIRTYDSPEDREKINGNKKQILGK